MHPRGRDGGNKKQAGSIAAGNINGKAAFYCFDATFYRALPARSAPSPAARQPQAAARAHAAGPASLRLPRRLAPLGGAAQAAVRETRQPLHRQEALSAAAEIKPERRTQRACEGRRAPQRGAAAWGRGGS